MSFWPLFVIMVVIFVGMVLMLRYILSRHYLTATARLQSLGADYSRRHEELKQRIAEAEQQYAEQVDRAKVEAERIVLQARQEADASRSKTLSDARQESERIVQQGLESRDAFRKEIEQQMDHRAIECACELIQVALPESLRRQIQSRWFDELLHNDVTPLDQLKTEEPIHEVKVASAFALSAEQRSALRERLTKTFGRDMTLAEETNDRLVAGLTITIGSRVLEGSLASKIQQAARRAQTSP